MQTNELVPHPDHPPVALHSMTAAISVENDNWLQLRWRMEGAGTILVPPFAGPHRADGLWKTTCFELFVREENDAGYSEFNLSPSEQWAAYDFGAYRAAMTERAMPRPPVVNWRGGRSGLALFDTAIPRSALPDFSIYGLSAVIEEEGRVVSYWALAHPTGQPDFHDPACFAGTLEAPGQP